MTQEEEQAYAWGFKDGAVPKKMSHQDWLDIGLQRGWLSRNFFMSQFEDDGDD